MLTSSLGVIARKLPIPFRSSSSRTASDTAFATSAWRPCCFARSIFLALLSMMITLTHPALQGGRYFPCPNMRSKNQQTVRILIGKTQIPSHRRKCQTVDRDCPDNNQGRQSVPDFPRDREKPLRVQTRTATLLLPRQFPRGAIHARKAVSLPDSFVLKDDIHTAIGRTTSISATRNRIARPLTNSSADNSSLALNTMNNDAMRSTWRSSLKSEIRRVGTYFWFAMIIPSSVTSSSPDSCWRTFDRANVPTTMARAIEL